MSNQRSLYLSITLGKHQMSRQDCQKERCYDTFRGVPLNCLLAFSLWFRVCWSSNSLFILKKKYLSSANLIFAGEKAGLTFHICKMQWQRLPHSNFYCVQITRSFWFCFVFSLLARKPIPFSSSSLRFQTFIKFTHFHLIHPWLSCFQAKML